MTKDTPDMSANCPRRLRTDCFLLKNDMPPAWLARRSNMMRERFSQSDHQAVPTLNLTAPVQPSINNPAIEGITPHTPRS